MIQSSPILGTNIVQISMPAKEALEAGMFVVQDQSFTGRWFTEWAQESPNKPVFAYTFGGIYGGFIFGEQADFETLQEFAQQADCVAVEIWQGIINEAWEFIGY